MKVSILLSNPAKKKLSLKKFCFSYLKPIIINLIPFNVFLQKNLNLEFENDMCKHNGWLFFYCHVNIWCYFFFENHRKWVWVTRSFGGTLWPPYIRCPPRTHSQGSRDRRLSRTASMYVTTLSQLFSIEICSLDLLCKRKFIFVAPSVKARDWLMIIIS